MAVALDQPEILKDRVVVGVPDTDDLLIRVDQIAFHGCTPPVTVVPEIIALDSRDVTAWRMFDGSHPTVGGLVVSGDAPLVHRDYTIPGPIRIFGFGGRVEVHSPGRPPNSVDDDAMRCVPACTFRGTRTSTAASPQANSPRAPDRGSGASPDCSETPAAAGRASASRMPRS